MGTMTLAYCEGGMNEVNPLSRRVDFVLKAKYPSFEDVEVPSVKSNLRRKSRLLLDDTQLNLMIVDPLRLSHDFVDLLHKGYSKDLLHGDDSEWTRNSQIDARGGHFWRRDRL
jgi:hypothetical protein